MKNIEFVEASESDLEALLDLYNYYLMNTTSTFDYNKIDIDEFKSRISFEQSIYKTFIIRQTEKSIGFCFLTRFSKKPAVDRTAEIGLYLYPEYTKKGIGKLAVEFLENYARETGIIKMILANISGENINSLKLFIKMKYEQCGHIKQIGCKFNRILDVIYLQKIL